MRERPILFSGPMIPAILEGRKTQTRRPIRPQPPDPEWDTWQYSGPGDPGHSGPGWYCHIDDYPDEGAMHWRCPYGAPGDRLWVREAFHVDADTVEDARRKFEDVYQPPVPILFYRATEEQRNPYAGWRWRPSIHMPRWASRIDLDITGVRVERVQGITIDDVIAEGILVPECAYDKVPEDPRILDAERSAYARRGFAGLWDKINGKRASWDSNPWVWVVEFRMVRP